MGDIGVNVVDLHFLARRVFPHSACSVEEKAEKKNAHLKEKHVLVSVHVCASSEDRHPDFSSRISCSNCRQLRALFQLRVHAVS